MFSSNYIAQLRNPVLTTNTQSLSGEGFFNTILPNIVLIALIVGVVVFFFMFLIGAIEWIFSGGIREKLEDARKRIANAMTGLVILLAIFVFVQIVNLVLGIDIGGIGTGGNQSGCVCTESVAANCGTGSCQPDERERIRTCPLECGGTTRTCVYDSSCLSPPGGPCTSDSDCSSGFCSSDADNDGDGYYGAYSSGVGTCQDGIADCRDDNADVHPDQFQYFETAIPGTFDDYNYDCADSDGDGDPNDKWPTLNCLAAPQPWPSCQDTPFTQAQIDAIDGWINAIPSCGSNLWPGASAFVQCVASYHTGDTSCSRDPWTFFIGCSMPCVTDNSCDWGNQQCMSWTFGDIYVYPSYVGERTQMPCK